MRPYGRWTARLIRYLAAGAIATLGVAWASAAFLPITRGVGSRSVSNWNDDRLAIVVCEMRTWTGSRRAWAVMDWHFAGTGDPFDWEDGTTFFRRMRHNEYVHAPFQRGRSWAPDPPDISSGRFPPDTRLFAEARGWPFLAFCCEFRWERDSAGKARLASVDGILIPWGGDTQLTRRALPYRPIWRGVAINILAWAAILALVSFVPGAIRRSLRRRVGRCPRCGYDVTDSAITGCPECGWNRSRIS
jgi:hypothetical protein